MCRDARGDAFDHTNIFGVPGRGGDRVFDGCAFASNAHLHVLLNGLRDFEGAKCSCWHFDGFLPRDFAVNFHRAALDHGLLSHADRYFDLERVCPTCPNDPFGWRWKCRTFVRQGFDFHVG